MSENFVKYELPKLIIGITGVLTILPFFIPNPTLVSIKASLGAWAVIIRNTAVFLGLVYMTISQYKNLQKNRSSAGYFFFAVPYAAILLHIGVALAFPGYINSVQYQWLYQSIYRALVGIYVSIPLFYCYSAAYRAFTVRSIEGAALMLGGMIYALRSIPLFVLIFPFLLPLGEWMTMVPNVGGGRGAVIAVALASLVVGLRTLAGKELTTIEVA